MKVDVGHRLGFHRKRPQMLFAVFLVFLVFALVQVFLETPKAMITGSTHQVDLSGDWEECIPPAPESMEIPNPNQCVWNKRKIPSAVPTQALSSARGWIIYRKRVNTPSFCGTNDPLCNVIVAEVGDAVEARVNGNVIGRHGGFPPSDRYARHYPVQFDLPPGYFNSSGIDNEIVLIIRHLKRAQSGILRGPFAIVPSDFGFSLTKALLAQNVLIPLICGLGALLIAGLSLLAIAFNRIRDPSLVAFTRYGIVSGAFLISYTSIPREYLPLGFAGCLHFMLRFLMDWMFFEMAAQLTGWFRVILWPGRMLYSAFMLLLIGAYASDGWATGVLSHYTGFNGAVLLSSWFDCPLVFGPYFYAMLAFIALRRENRTAVVWMMALIAALSLCGTLTFHGVLGLPYFVHFYPFFITLILGIDLWGGYLFTHERLQSESEVGRMATQVAHDILSPLAALKSVEHDLSGLEEDKRLMLRMAVGRIAGIANELLNGHRVRQDFAGDPDGRVSSEPESQSTQNLSENLAPLIIEKRLQFRSKAGIRIDAQIDTGLDGFAVIQPIEFQRIISNLINNAVEACGESGLVKLVLSSDPKHCLIVIQDNGRGISKEVLPKLMKMGGTHGKDGGHGLGLFHAKIGIERWQGKIDITSELGKGTRIEIKLPRAVAPTMVQIEYDAILIDDDKLVRLNWELSAEGCQKIIRTFESVEDFLAVKGEIPFLTAVYIDSQLGNDARGELESRKIFESGFKTIYLATGLEKDLFDLKTLHWVKGVIKKEPPWSD